MGEILDLAKAAQEHVGIAAEAIRQLQMKLDASKDDVVEFDLQKQALDNINKEVSKQSAELSELTQKVAQIKELRAQLAELRHNA